MLKETIKRGPSMRTNNHWIQTIFLFALFSLIWVPSIQAAGKSSYKIGVNLELTGPWAEVNKILKNTLGMEVERINAAGGDQRPSPRTSR